MVVIPKSLLASARMNILIENADSQEFFTASGTWSKNVTEGKTFGTTVTAYETAKKESVGKFNIVCHIPATNQFVNLSHGKGKAEAGAAA